jgi:hypothetical protein
VSQNGWDHQTNTEADASNPLIFRKLPPDHIDHDQDHNEVEGHKRRQQHKGQFIWVHNNSIHQRTKIKALTMYILRPFSVRAGRHLATELQRQFKHGPMRQRENFQVQPSLRERGLD